MKFNYGSLGNYEGAEAPIVINGPMFKRREIITGGLLLLLGLSYTLFGIESLTSNAFRNGVAAYEQAEYKTMVDLNLIKED